MVLESHQSRNKPVKKPFWLSLFAWSFFLSYFLSYSLTCERDVMLTIDKVENSICRNGTGHCRWSKRRFSADRIIWIVYLAHLVWFITGIYWENKIDEKFQYESYFGKILIIIKHMNFSIFKLTGYVNIKCLYRIDFDRSETRTAWAERWTII